MKKKLVWLYYDGDTILGINNQGELVYQYFHEDTDYMADGTPVYSGQDSVFFKNIKAAFFNDLASMYKTLRTNPDFCYDKIEKRFEEHQNKWPEAVFNEDALFKYILPYTEDGTETYLPMLQGPKTEQRKSFLYKRFRYIDSKYVTGDAISDAITLRAYAVSDISLTPYMTMYPSVAFGQTVAPNPPLRTQKGETRTIACPFETMNNVDVHIYNAGMLSSVGDLSGFHAGSLDISKGIKLTSIKLGDSDPEYSNTNLKTLTFGNNIMLKTADIRNCTGLNTQVDMSNCENLENAYYDGTNVTFVSFPNGGNLKIVHLPASITNLTLINQHKITNLTIAGYSNLTTLRIENSFESIDLLTLMGLIPAKCRVRLIGFTYEASSVADINSLFDMFDAHTGLDENGDDTAKAQVSGTVHIGTITGDEMETLASRYSSVNIVADHTTCTLRYYNYDGSELVGTETVADGGNGTSTLTVSRDPDVDYRYTFAGWSKYPNGAVDDNARASVTKNRNVYAAYTRTAIITIIYYDDDGTTVLHVDDVTDSHTGTYNGSDRQTVQYVYTFNGWALTLGGPVDANARTNVTTKRSLYAVYTQSVRTYSAYFYNGNTLLATQTGVPYGTTPTYSGQTPQDGEDMEFTGWNPALDGITGDTNYYAQFKDTSDPFLKFAMRTIRTVDDDAIETVGYYAFDGCSYLTNISLPAATQIGSYALRGCGSLTNVSLPAATSIGLSAFSACTSLTDISLPSATSIGDYAFYQCSSLTNVSLPVATSISGDAFFACPSLTNVYLPAATSIEDYAFRSCSKLESVSLPAATSIGTGTFSYCSKLASVSLPVVTSIGVYVFQACYKLESVSLPVATWIGSNAFDSCTSLTDISLPAATTISGSAFNNCTKLTDISLPAATQIRSNAFDGCSSLTDIYLPNAEDTYSNAPWGATNATIHYNTTFDSDGNPITT